MPLPGAWATNENPYQREFYETRSFHLTSTLALAWSTPANISLGEEVKFTIQGNKMTILDDDQKQQKATIVKASITRSL